MTESDGLVFQAEFPVVPGWAGHLISRGIGRHPRRLRQDYELIFVREGVLEIAEEGHAFSVSANQTLLLLPNRWHHGTQDYAPDLSFFWIHFTMKASTQTSSLTASPEALFHVPQQTTVSRPDYLAELFLRYIDDLAGNRQDPVAAGLLLLLILNEAQTPRSARTSGSASVLAARAESVIRTSFHLPLTASVVADQVGCNPHYLSRIYRQSYGCTLTEAIHRTRIDYGCRLLLSSDLRVGEIARACGMEDANYFHQLFKRRKGLTPSAYRRLHAPANINTE